jgi:hypothetical protein
VQLLRRVRAVRVHLDHGLVPVLARPAEPGHVGGAQALLAGPVQDVHGRVGGGEPVGDLAGAVRAVVVGDEDVHLGYRPPQPIDDDLDVVGLVVGGNHHENAPDPGIAVSPLRCRALAQCSSSVVYE